MKISWKCVPARREWLFFLLPHNVSQITSFINYMFWVDSGFQNVDNYTFLLMFSAICSTLRYYKWSIMHPKTSLDRRLGWLTTHYFLISLLVTIISWHKVCLKGEVCITTMLFGHVFSQSSPNCQVHLYLD